MPEPRIPSHQQQSYEPYPDLSLQPFLKATRGLENLPGENGFSMARANKRLTAAMSSAEASTAAETLNETANPRKSFYGSQIIDASPINSSIEQ